MHRELTHADEAFARPSDAGLYAFTGLLGALILRDLWPIIAAFLGGAGADVGAWSFNFLGFRFALIAAVLGGARTLYSALDSLLAGRLGADLAVAIACIAAILINEPLVAAEVVFIALSESASKRSPSPALNAASANWSKFFRASVGWYAMASRCPSIRAKFASAIACA